MQDYDEATSAPAVVAPFERRVGLHATALPRVLDPCCGSRMMWFDPQHLMHCSATAARKH